MTLNAICGRDERPPGRAAQKGTSPEGATTLLPDKPPVRHWAELLTHLESRQLIGFLNGLLSVSLGLMHTACRDLLPK